MSDITYLEDIKVGTVHEFGHYDVSRDEVIDFAKKYDPQPFHLSDDAAAKTHFKKLAASGWHTCAMMMAMLVKHFTGQNTASLGSPGVDELRWKRPVYPGDKLRMKTQVVEVKPSSSRPEMGSVRSTVDVINQDDVVVMSFISIGLVATRPQT